MMVPPLSERPVTDEDEEQFRAESTPASTRCAKGGPTTGRRHDAIGLRE